MRFPVLLVGLAVFGLLVYPAVGRGGVSALFTDQASVGGNSMSTDTLDPPTGLSASGSVTLNWTATPDTYASGHRVLRSTTSGGPYSQIAEITPRTTTTYVDSVCAGTYYYVARAYFQNWESANSNQATGTGAGSSSSYATIAFRSAASAGAGSGVLTLTISKPAGTVSSDVMIAAVGVRQNTGVSTVTATITPASGWALVRRMDNTATWHSSMAVYYKVAGSSEPASYSWTFSSSIGAAGGIESFSGVDTASPIDAENGQATPLSLSHATPSITTTVANAMLVAHFSMPSAATWTPPGGMTEAFDVASQAVPNTLGHSTEGTYAVQAAAGATGAKTATASANSDPGNTHILALQPAKVAAFVAATSAGSSGTTLTINRPAGTAACDVMVAAVAFRPETAAITPPAGWTLVRRIDNSNIRENSLAVYYKVAGSSEPASYSWTLSTSTGIVGGIRSFRGVDTADPIDVENGQNTSSGLSHATPSVTTTVAYTMLVTSHGFSSAATWTAPAGMTEAFDVASLAVPNGSGESMDGAYVLQAAAGSSGTKTATASGDSDVGNAHILALRPAP